MLSTEFNSVTKLIKENEIPVVVFTDTSESYLINNINELINNARNNTEVSLDIVLEDLISLGGSGGDSRPYKVYTALLTQSGTNAPVATVLENTLGGDIVWSYDSIGTYSIFSAVFTENTFVILGNRTEEVSANTKQGYNPSINQVLLYTFYLGESGTVDYNDNIFLNTSIEIRVYN
jgi:hypothetical protein